MVRDKDRKMATAPRSKTVRRVDYPTSDGKPVAETELHWQVMVDVVEPMRDYFAADPMVHVGGNLLLFYEENNRRKHVSPDAFMVRGIPKLPLRDYYLLWEEGKPPDVVIEITSKTTKREDQTKKRVLYRDVLKIPEYFQFDPTEDYLKPSLQGVLRIGDDCMPILAVNGRLPSAVLGLHLERAGQELKLWDPAHGSWLLTPRQRADAAEQQAAMERQTAEAAQRQFETAQRQLEEEIQRLRQENEAIKNRLAGADEG
jgi:Uma2 family endonuclease